MQATAAPMFKPELTEESARSQVNHDDARADLRLTAEGGPRPAGPLSQTPQSPDLPRHVAQQIVEALQRGGGGKERGIDLLLNPAELGRVRISLSPGEAGLTVHIVADRPETLDLMRRHIDMLAQDFQSIGYDATDFAFAQHDHEAADQGQNAPQQHIPHVTKEAEASSRITATIITDRVDIRL
jgi:flagellar hook-length control protein FliK